MKTYKIQDREAGNVIETGLTYNEAEEMLAQFEETDKNEGNYTPDFYEIKEEVETTYKITLTFSNPYIGSRYGGNRVLETGLTLNQAYNSLLDLYNQHNGDDRGYAETWEEAVEKSQRIADSAYPTREDGTRKFEWDSRIFQIEEEEEDGN
jgi:hypothetical protein